MIFDILLSGAPKTFKFWYDQRLFEAARFQDDLYCLKHRLQQTEVDQVLHQVQKQQEKGIRVTAVDNEYCVWVNLRKLNPDDLRALVNT